MEELKLEIPGLTCTKFVPSLDDIPYAIGVQFNEHGTWSKPYTYKSKLAYKKGDIVLVPTNNFYTVGKVVACTKVYEFKKNINYKFIITSLTESLP